MSKIATEQRGEHFWRVEEQVVMEDYSPPYRYETPLFVVLLLALVACAVWVRFEHITDVGLGRSFDNGSYVKHARDSDDGSEIERFAPTVFLMDRLTLHVFGDHDYSIKSLRATTDLCVFFLLMVLVWHLTGDRWAGLASGLLYAFSTKIVYYARTEMPHAPAALVLLTGFFLFVAYMQKRSPIAERKDAFWAGALLISSGFFAGMSMTIQPSLCFVGPVFVVCIAVGVTMESSATITRCSIFVRDAAIFTLCFFLAVGLLSTVTYPLPAIVDYMMGLANASNDSESVWTYSYNLRAFESGVPEPFIEGMTFLLRGMRYIAGGEYNEFMIMGSGGLYPLLFFGTFPIMLIVAIRQRGASPAWAYVLVVSVVFYALLLGYFLRIYTIGTSRYLIPLFPIAILAICWWYYTFIRCYVRQRWAGMVLLMATIMVVVQQNPVFPGAARLEQPYTIAKELYDAIGDRVDDEHRLLALPYGVGVFVFERQSRTAIWLSHDYYFGKNALWPREVDTSDVGTGDVTVTPSWITYEDAVSLLRACKQERVRYVFVAFYTDPNVYYQMEYPFNEEGERRLIRAFLQGLGAERIYYSASGIVYKLPEIEDSMEGVVASLEKQFELEAAAKAVKEEEFRARTFGTEP